MNNLLHTPFISWRQHPAALALGVAAVVDATAPKSALGRSRLEGHMPFHPGRRSEAQQHFRNMAGVRDAFDSDGDRAAAVAAVLEDLPDIRDILPALPDIDFTALARLFQFVEACDALARHVPADGCFAALAAAVADLQPLRATLRNANGAPEGFRLADSAAPKLETVRRELTELGDDISAARDEHIRRVRRDVGLPAGIGSVVVSAGDPAEPRIRAHESMRCRREDGVSALFVIADTPAIDSMETRRGELLQQERRLQQDICRDLGRVAARAEEALGRAAAAVGDLDFLMALLDTAPTGCFPDLRDDADIRIDGGTLPAVADRCGRQGETYQPLDITLPVGMTVLRGANMSGKTVALKTLGYLVALAHAGLPLPAKTAHLPLLDALWMFEPGTGDMRQGLSAFGREIAFWRDIGDALRDRPDMTALLLADEPMRTTNNEEGRALLLALLTSLETRRRTMGLVTTHIDGLQAAGVRLSHMAGLDDAGREAFARGVTMPATTLRGLMDYRVVSGDDRRGSDAVAVAALLGLDSDITDAAKKHLKT